jgi:hypothetical protein
LIIIITIGFSRCCSLFNETLGDEVREYFEDKYNVNNETILSVFTINRAISVNTRTGEYINLNATKRSRNGADDLKKRRDNCYRKCI